MVFDADSSSSFSDQPPVLANLTEKKCFHCNLTFQTAAVLKLHLKQIHNVTVERPRKCKDEIVPQYFCDLCDKGYARKYDMLKHREKAHPNAAETAPTQQTPLLVNLDEKQCLLCNSTFRTQIDVRLHLKQAHNIIVERQRKRKSEIEPEFFCDLCDKGYARKYDMLKHREKAHPNAAKLKISQQPELLANLDEKQCSRCNLTFRTQIEVRLHLKEAHNIVVKRQRKCKDEIEPEFFCDLCDKGYARKHDMLKHREKAHPDAGEPVETQPTELLANLDEKQCLLCNLTFRTQIDLRLHVKQAHNVTVKRQRKRKSEIEPQFYCDLCDKGYARKHDMLKHREKMHPDAAENAQLRQTAQMRNSKILKQCLITPHDDTAAKRVKWYKCDYCIKVFSNSTNLLRHRTIHTGILPFCCHLCGKQFRIATSLFRHIKHSHQGVRPFKCDVCDKTFATKVNREEHMNIHNNVRPFVCDECGKSFKQRASLRIHKMYHANVFPFECEICGKKYRRAGELRLHSFLHTGKKPHGCPKCKATFRLKHDLTRHLKRHKKKMERGGDLVCGICESTFGQERYLKLHMRMHEGNENLVE